MVFTGCLSARRALGEVLVAGHRDDRHRDRDGHRARTDRSGGG